MSNVCKYPTQSQSFNEGKPWIEKLGEGLSNDKGQAVQVGTETNSGICVILRQMVEIWDKMNALPRLSCLFLRPSSLRMRSIGCLMMITPPILFAYAENVPSVSVGEFSVVVSEGEDIRLGSDAEEVETFSSAGVEVNISWREGNLVFIGANL